MEGFLEKTDLLLENLISTGDKITYLVGAGCSMDEPSCMPSGRSMLGDLVKFMCPAAEVDGLLKLGNLRYEGVVEEFRNQFDKELELIRFFEACDRPNLQHFFLASMLKRGHFLLTTNFDSLIELALLQSGVAKEDVIPVIKKADFERYGDPAGLHGQGKVAVYKVHGSTRNYITGEETRESLVATLQAFGSNKEGLSVFQVESFKQPLFTNITRQRSLVVMGYSGGDDFDVIPTLKALDNLKSVIWLNFVPDDGGKEVVYEVSPGAAGSATGIKQVLLGMKQKRSAEHVYWVDVNTSRAAGALLQERPPVNPEKYVASTLQWLQEHFPAPTEWYKYHCAYTLYLKLGHYPDALRCAEAMLPLATTTAERIAPVENVARILLETGRYNEALAKYQEAFNLVAQVNDVTRQATYCINIGELNRRLGNVQGAMTWFTTGLQYAEATGDIAKKAPALVNLGGMYSQMGMSQQALQYYTEALRLTDQLGDLSNKAQILNNIATAYVNLGNFDEALKHFNVGLQIAENLGDQERRIRLLANIGNISIRMGKHAEGLDYLDKGLKAAEAVGDISQKATILNNIGGLLKLQEKHPDAIASFNAALGLADQLGDPNIKLQSLMGIGATWQAMGKLPEASGYYGQALEVAEKLNNTMEIGTIHNNLGAMCREQGKPDEALVHFQECLAIAEKTGYQELQAYSFKNLGAAYFDKGDDAKAAEYYNRSLQIAARYPALLPALYEGMGDLLKRQGKKKEAADWFTQAMQVLLASGLQNSPRAAKVAEKLRDLA
ncbi:MAG: tetratricopeptide repeat protein [Candidatus Lokiarchaeota archaeon]|nr:tetratricopeptide repeat protein [Candidatus Lokiarchaeota archaeon]